MRLLSVTRRFLFALTVGLFASTVAGQYAVAAEPAKPIRALMVTGGCCHDYEAQKIILSEGISARANVEWTIVHEGKTRTDRVSIYEKADWAKGYDVVLHNECYGAIEDVPYVERIAKPHFDGVPAVMLHCSAHSYRAAKTDEWRQAVGQTSMSHEKNRDLTIKVVAGEHPIMRGFPDNWLDPADELYKNEKLWPNFVPLAKAYGEDTKRDHFVIWTNTYGKGKVFGTTLGHNNGTMRDPVYLDLVTRGLLWACDKLDAEGKPVVGYGPKGK
ncbi:MAG: ThuA domain-containing protein [Planctomycetales bacterium]|nr:ThuA domain-containing protein [Planctomycetales bacterium]MBN8627278.1 ThuA domain-containing protein [Planctomycetota bacterium]